MNTCQTNVPLKADECVRTMMSVNHKWLNQNEGDSLNAPLTLEEVRHALRKRRGTQRQEGMVFA
jgi:hypothetical protein